MINKFFKCRFNRTSRVSLSIIYLSMLSFKIIGLSTFSVHSESSPKNGKSPYISIKYSKSGIAYNIILIVLWIASQILTFPLRKFDYPGKSHITDNIHVQETFASMMTVLVLLASYCSNQKLMVQVGKQLINMQKTFDKKKFLYRREILCRAVTITAVYLLIITMFNVINCIQYIITAPSINILFVYAVDTFSLFIICFSLIQYFLTVLIIHAKFAGLNKSIAKLPNKLFKEESRTIALNVDQQVLPSASTTSQIVFIKDTYNRLLDLSYIIDEAFAVPIYFSLLYLVMRIINTTFYTVAIIMSIDPRKYSAMSPVACLVCVLIPISLLTFTVTACKNEAAQTTRVVHDLLKSTNDQKLITELEFFSLQLLHEKPQFTACGFFTLDCSMLRGIIATVTTYMVILIQFHEATP